MVIVGNSICHLSLNRRQDSQQSLDDGLPGRRRSTSQQQQRSHQCVTRAEEAKETHIWPRIRQRNSADSNNSDVPQMRVVQSDLRQAGSGSETSHDRHNPHSCSQDHGWLLQPSRPVFSNSTFSGSSRRVKNHYHLSTSPLLPLPLDLSPMQATPARQHRT